MRLDIQLLIEQYSVHTFQTSSKISVQGWCWQDAVDRYHAKRCLDWFVLDWVGIVHEAQALSCSSATYHIPMMRLGNMYPVDDH